MCKQYRIVLLFLYYFCFHFRCESFEATRRALWEQIVSYTGEGEKVKGHKMRDR